MWILGLIVGIIVLLVYLTVLFLNRFVNDQGVAKFEKTQMYRDIKKVLVVLAHPDDEVMIAGSLKKFKKNGAEVHLLYFTHGEDGPTSGVVEKAELGPERAKELAMVKNVLEADSLTILDFPDRYLNTVAKESLEQALINQLETIKPDTVISFDTTIGLYGNDDHVCVGEIVHSLLPKHDDVKNLLVMTLPQSMINLATRISTTFKDRYHAENGGLPAPDFSMSISRFGKDKKAVVAAHRTQAVVLNDVQPLWNKIPYWLYYRIFAKEYFQVINLSKELDS